MSICGGFLYLADDLRPHPDAVHMTHEFLRGHGIHPHLVNKTDDGQTWSFWVSMERANTMCKLG